MLYRTVSESFYTVQKMDSRNKQNGLPCGLTACLTKKVCAVYIDTKESKSLCLAILQSLPHFTGYLLVLKLILRYYCFFCKALSVLAPAYVWFTNSLQAQFLLEILWQGPTTGSKISTCDQRWPGFCCAGAPKTQYSPISLFSKLTFARLFLHWWYLFILYLYNILRYGCGFCF